jgi:DNA-binding response OmpR family regulator
MTSGVDRIISVEDSDTDFMALQFALQAAGVKTPVERCASGRVAMDSLLEADDCPLTQKARLILLDLNLPGVDGRQLVKELRARDLNREVPIIVLSTSSHQKDIDYCYQAGADAYLVKPLELDEWETKVAALVEFWLRAACAPQPSDSDAKARTLGIEQVDGTIKEAEFDGCTERMALIARAIEQEIIPRLLLAHADNEPARPERSGRLNRILPCEDDVAELARLVMEHDVSLAASYVARKRGKGSSLESVFLSFIAPAARLVGDLWKADLCSFDQFSRALIRLQDLLAELNPSGESETIH